MRDRLPSLMGAVVLLAACGRPVTLETRTFRLNHITPGEASAIIDPYVFTDRPGAPGRLNNAATSITVRETRDNLDRITRVLVEYDRPIPGLRLTFRLIEADGTAATDPAIADIEAVLRKLFRFRGYRVIGEGVVAAVERHGIQQHLGGPMETFVLDAMVNHIQGTGDSATVQLTVRLIDGLSTGLTIPVGKTAVVGSAQSNRGKGTLILTVRPEFVSP